MTGETHAFMKIRRAEEGDQGDIQRMVREAQLGPFNLHWSNFVVAEIGGEIVAIGQVRPYPNAPEVGSIITLPRWRKQGIAARIIERLIADHPGTLYLKCRKRMTTYYERFGFREIAWQDAPQPLRTQMRIGTFLGKLFGFEGAVMKREAE